MQCIRPQRYPDAVCRVMRAGGPAPSVATQSVKPLEGERVDAASALASTHVHGILRSPGQPLDPETRTFFESRFGHDFSQVRVHADGAAAASARQVDAQAYTVGQHIVFGAGQHQPRSWEGRHLLAHELTHVVQQSNGAQAVLARKPGPAAQPPPDPHIAVSQSLQKDLRKKKRDDVLKQVEGMSPAERDALDTATTQLTNEADELRRIIRFTQHMPPPPTDHVDARGTGGTTAGGKPLPVGKGTVELKTGVLVDAKSAPGLVAKDTLAFSLSYNGPDAADMRWLQFAWREIVAENPAAAKGGKPRLTPEKKRLDFVSKPYHLTTDPGQPSWLVDSAKSPPAPPGSAPSGNNPFVEENAGVARSANELTMTDFPSPIASVAFDLLASASKPTRVVSHFHADTYLVHGMDVLYRGEIDLRWEFSAKQKEPSVQFEAKGGPAKAITSSQRARLAILYGDVDYLPGPAIGAPDPREAFDLVPETAPTASGTLSDKQWSSASDPERFGDIARIAHSELIDDVTGMSANTIHRMGASKSGAAPGLNYWTKLPVQGETGYVDEHNAYIGPLIPITRRGPLPRVAIILGPSAFAQGKVFAIATLRHEMAHASHAQTAIRWLLSWRDDPAAGSFVAWVDAKHRAKRMGDVDFGLVSDSIAATGSAFPHTELLAWVEGMMTGMPFLPAKPELSLMRLGTPPATIAELKGAGRFFDVVGPGLQKAALDRIHEVCCNAVDKTHRDSFASWLVFILDPAAVRKPGSAEEEATVKLVNNDFAQTKPFVRTVLQAVRRRC